LVSGTPPPLADGVFRSFEHPVATNAVAASTITAILIGRLPGRSHALLDATICPSSQTWRDVRALTPSIQPGASDRLNRNLRIALPESKEMTALSSEGP
jgi:hypothetical protein